MFIDFKDGGKEREKLAASHTHPNCRLNPQPRYVTWLEIERTTFWCKGLTLQPTEPSSQGSTVTFCVFLSFLPMLGTLNIANSDKNTAHSIPDGTYYYHMFEGRGHVPLKVSFEQH